MNYLLKIEELGLFLLSIFLFSQLQYSWWVFLLFILTPDIGVIGYLISPRTGSITYNLTHHKGLAVVLFVAGTIAPSQAIALTGVIMLGHSSLDRVFGYGLKLADSFNHTHLGWIGRARLSNMGTELAPPDYS
jgi:hypothetical protein